MNVLVIMSDSSWDEHEAYAVVEMPDGADGDDVFVAWLRGRNEHYATWTRPQLLGAYGYSWHVMETERLPQ